MPGPAPQEATARRHDHRPPDGRVNPWEAGRRFAAAGGRTAATVIAGALGGLASLRRAPAFHPTGSVHQARLTIAAGDHVLGRLAGDVDAVVRVSRGAGLPSPLPDVLGLAVRTLGRHGVDVLMSSSGRGRVTRHLLVPGRDPGALHFSSLAPFVDDAGRRFVIGASPTTGDARTFTLQVAAPRRPWQDVGTLRLAEPDDADDQGALEFDPWRVPTWMRPAGLLNALRRPAYGASQAARADHTGTATT